MATQRTAGFTNRTGAGAETDSLAGRARPCGTWPTTCPRPWPIDFVQWPPELGSVAAGPLTAVRPIRAITVRRSPRRHPPGPTTWPTPGPDRHRRSRRPRPAATSAAGTAPPSRGRAHCRGRGRAPAAARWPGTASCSGASCGARPPALGLRVLETSPRLGDEYRRAMGRWFDYRCSDYDERAHRGMLRLDLQAIDLPDATVDVLLTPHVVEHVPDTDRALAEIHRILAPGGRMYLQVPVLQGRTGTPTRARVPRRPDAGLLALRLRPDRTVAGCGLHRAPRWSPAPGPTCPPRVPPPGPRARCPVSSTCLRCWPASAPTT